MSQPSWDAIDEVGNDNFATSIYEAGAEGLLVARCNQNGQYPWQGPAIIRGLEQNKSIAAARIEALEATLREIEWHDPKSPAAAAVRAVLGKDTGK
jgi:hypothetical protein